MSFAECENCGWCSDLDSDVVIRMSKEEWEWFSELLDNPSTPPENLIEAFKKYRNI